MSSETWLNMHLKHVCIHTSTTHYFIKAQGKGRNEREMREKWERIIERNAHEQEKSSVVYCGMGMGLYVNEQFCACNYTARVSLCTCTGRKYMIPRGASILKDLLAVGTNTINKDVEK